MKKVTAILMTIVMILAISAAMADPVKIDGLTQRNIKINKAGENTADAGISPTTGRSLADVGKEVKDGFLGMAVTGQYMPLMVQVTNSGSGVGNRAPLFASYADVIYEAPKDSKGVTRCTMVFSDTIPEWVGCTRSLRVMHVWIREEWNAPIVYHGHQSSSTDGRTDVSSAIRALGWHVPEAPNSPGASVFYDGMYPKDWNKYHYRIKSMGKISDNVCWYAPGIMENIVAKQDIQPRNHTYLFSDTLPEGGDDATNVYVSWNNTANKTSEESNPFYFNAMYEYDEDEGVYYKYLLKDAANINAATVILYDELAPVSVKITGSEVTMDLTHGNPITFSNVIIQSVDIDWSKGNDQPVIVETGTGNADIFMGGKHYAGVWNRDTLTERTVFYDESGNEIPLQRGKTMIILMDYNKDIRQVSYE